MGTIPKIDLGLGRNSVCVSLPLEKTQTITPYMEMEHLVWGDGDNFTSKGRMEISDASPPTTYQAELLGIKGSTILSLYSTKCG